MVVLRDLPPAIIRWPSLPTSRRIALVPPEVAEGKARTPRMMTRRITMNHLMGIKVITLYYIYLKLIFNLLYFTNL